MRKILVLFFSLIIFVSNSYVQVFAEDKNIRIGLTKQYTGVSSIKLNDNDISIRLPNGDSYAFNSGTGFTAKAAELYYYDSGMDFDSYKDARLYTNVFSSEVYPALVDGKWRVLFEKNTEKVENNIDSDNNINSVDNIDSENTIDSENNIDLGDNIDFKDNSGSENNSDSKGINSIKLDECSLMFSVNEGESFIVESNSNIDILNSDDLINIGTNSYRGYIELKRVGNVINAVNVIGLEDYIKSVVTAEMPSSWHKEALKAQAVAARTYAVKNMGKHGSYDLCDTTDCQAYSGKNSETQSGIEAVNATKGIMAYYNNVLIDATYFSSSGGYTKSALDVWGKDIPYLQAVREINEKDGKQWSKTYTYGEFTTLCINNGINIGKITDVSPSSTLEGGYLKTMLITGTEGSITIDNSKIKQLFKSATAESNYSSTFKLTQISTAGNTIMLPQKQYHALSVTGNNIVLGAYVYAISADGVISKVSTENISVYGQDKSFDQVSDEISTRTFTIYGGGYGHGVGMSQFGAKGMAELGYSYKDILKHYYTGIEVK